MRIHNIYVDDAGETHWRDIEVQWVEERNASKLSARLPANGIIFRETGGDYDLSWHPAPRRQYIINLDGGVKITASDGEAREIGAGEVILVEDIRGKGHLSKSIGQQGKAFDLRAGRVATQPCLATCARRNVAQTSQVASFSPHSRPSRSRVSSARNSSIRKSMTTLVRCARCRRDG